MAIFFELFSFLSILKECIKILPKNGKLMALIAIFSMLLNSTFFMITTMMSDSILPPDPINKVSNMLAVKIAAVNLVFSIISFFLNIATTLVSSASYNGTKLSIKELFSMLRKTWTRSLITTFYVTGLMFVYFFVVTALTIPLLILYPNRAAISIAILIWIAAYFLYLYLFVSWKLAIVVSVIEESCYGIKALTRSSKLVKGNKFHGFLLNCGFSVVSLIIFQGLIGHKESTVLYGLFLVNISSLMVILFLVAYTVLYFNCKMHHGEEIEFYGSVHQYAKLPTTVPLVNGVDMA